MVARCEAASCRSFLRDLRGEPTAGVPDDRLRANAVRYRSGRPDDPALRERLRALARERRRFGYRLLIIFLRREGFVVNHERLPKSGCAS